jgi:dienelactone hydrolase
VNELKEVAATLGAPGWPLPGVLTLPRVPGRLPAVVLVHDLGPLDRDAKVGAQKPFLELARGLGARGVATLRYDKRTLAHGRRVAELDDLTVDDELLDDALAALAALRLRKDIDPERLFVLGHGLGGMLAPRLAARDRGLAGLVLLAPPARPIPTLLVEQTEYLMSLEGADADAQEVVLATLQHDAALALSEDLDEDDEPILGAPPSYWLDLRGYDPVAAAAKLEPSRRIFVAQGGRDHQVGGEDFARWQRGLAARAGAITRLYPALDHLFVAGAGKSKPADYLQAGRVADELLDDLATWIVGNVKTSLA